MAFHAENNWFRSAEKLIWRDFCGGFPAAAPGTPLGGTVRASRVAPSDGVGVTTAECAVRAQTLDSVSQLKQAVWVSSLVFLMLVLLHDRIDHVFGGQNHGKGEHWLVLDAKDRVAMVVARPWCFAMGFGPWLLAVTTARMVLFHAGVYQSRVFFFEFQLL